MFRMNFIDVEAIPEPAENHEFSVEEGDEIAQVFAEEVGRHIDPFLRSGVAGYDDWGVN